MPRNQFPARGPLGSATEFFVITPDDEADLDQVPRAVWVGTGGDLVVIGPEGTDPVTLANIADGTLLPISPTRITEATTADDLVGLV